MTVSVGNARFQRPILVDNLVELKARIVATGRTGMHIHDVSVVHAGDPKSGVLRQTAGCLVVVWYSSRSTKAALGAGAAVRASLDKNVEMKLEEFAKSAV